VLRGADLDHRIGEVDPHGEGEEYWVCKPLPEAAADPNAQRSARVVNEFVERAAAILENHPVNVQRRSEGLPPANAALPRGVGTAVELGSFEAKYGMRGAMIVEVDLVRGLGDYLSMNVVDVPDATGGADTDEMAIARAVEAAWSDHDFILANIKAPDLGGHDGNPEAKIASIEKVDRAVGYLLDTLDWSRTVMMLAADHCTPCTLKDHSGDAIPVAFCGYGVRPDGVTSYGERAAALGSIGHIEGEDIMRALMSYSGRQPKFGA
jgi:2,3-bisphosphoglycerate-independent phosphoglycerate mutase